MCHFHSKIKDKKFRILAYIGMFLGGIALAVLFAFLFGFLVMFIWNNVMVSVFGLAQISFWQAFGLIILAKIFFGGHGPKPHPVHNKKEHIKGQIQSHFKGDHTHEDYKRFWEEEGREAFENFINKSKSAE